MTSYKSALVTGASSGIGTDFARELARRGVDLVLVARRTERLEALAAELSNVKVEVLTADLGTDEGVSLVEQRLAAEPVELLVNNAGIGSGGALHEIEAAREAQLVHVNVVALHRLTMAALPAMITAGHGGVLNVSSIAGDQPLRGYAAYSASKTFVTTFTESIAHELKSQGVHVTLLKPGYVFTEMTSDNQPDRASMQAKIWQEPAAVASRALDAVEKGQLICVPGAAWKAASLVITSAPRPWVRALTTRIDMSGAG